MADCIQCGGPARLGQRVCESCRRSLDTTVATRRFQLRIGPAIAVIVALTLVVVIFLVVGGGSLGKRSITVTPTTAQSAEQLRDSANRINQRFDEIHLSVSAKVVGGGLTLSVANSLNIAVTQRLVGAGRISLRPVMATRPIEAPAAPTGVAGIVLPADVRQQFASITTCPATGPKDPIVSASRWLVACDATRKQLSLLAPTTLTGGGLSNAIADDTDATTRADWHLTFALSSEAQTAFQQLTQSAPKRQVGIVMDGVLYGVNVEANGDGQTWTIRAIDSEWALELSAVINSGALVGGFDVPGAN